MQSLLLKLGLVGLTSSACASERGRGSTRACGRHAWGVVCYRDLFDSREWKVSLNCFNVPSQSRTHWHL